MNHRNPLFKQLIVLSLFGSLVVFVGCAKSSGTFPLKTQPTDPSTSNPDVKPSIYREEGVEVIRGGMESENLKVSYDEVSRDMTIKGQLQVKPYGGGPVAVVDISLAGTLSDGQRINLKPSTTENTPPPGMKIAAKATCIDEAGGCAASFIDIYVQYNDHIYHHQIETSADDGKDTPKSPTPVEPKPPKKLPTFADLDKEEVPKVSEKDDDGETIEEDDDVGSENGHFIGDLKGDLKELFDVDPKPEASPSPSPTVTTPPEEKPATPVEPTPEKKPEAKPETKPEPKPVEKPKAQPEKKQEVKPQPKVEPKPETKPAPAKPAPAVPVTTPEKPKTTPTKPEVKTPKTPPEVKPEVKPETKPEPKQEEPKPVTPAPAKPATIENPLTGLTNISKKIYQVIGASNNGFLQNAINLFDLSKRKEPPPGFYISKPELKRYYGSNELIYLIQKMGAFSLNKMPGYSVRVGDLSKEKGGQILTLKRGKWVEAHKSHKSGVDADIAYYFKDRNRQNNTAITANGTPRPEWLIETQWELYKMFNETKLVDVIYVHRKVKKALCLYAIAQGEITKNSNDGLAYETLWRLQPREDDHHDHFHLRAKCSSIQQGCKVAGDPVRTTGCF